MLAEATSICFVNLVPNCVDFEALILTEYKSELFSRGELLGKPVTGNKSRDFLRQILSNILPPALVASRWVLCITCHVK